MVLELIEGAASKREVNEIMKFVEPFPVYGRDAADCERALLVFAQAHLSHRIDLVDVLNAETAIGLGVKLAAHNRKHFQAIPQLETTQPYKKN